MPEEYLQLTDDQDPGPDRPGKDEPASAEDQAARDQFMALARKRFRESEDGEHEIRLAMLKDREFAGGGAAQWMINGVNEQDRRWKEGKPAVTTNQIPGHTRQVTNAMRESRPSIQYVGVDDDHDPELAEVLQGLARHVEQNSMADIAYETAAEHMVEGGRGWIYARADYVHDETDEQDIFIKRVRNPETIFPDPACLEFDYSDMRYLHHVEDMPLDTYNELYPDAPIASLAEFTSLGTGMVDWCWAGGRVRVSNYYYIERVEKTLVSVAPAPDPTVPMMAPPQQGAPIQAPQGQAPAKMRFLEDLNADEKARVIGGPVRKVKVPKPMFAKINGIGIIEGNEQKTGGRPIPGRYIPYVPFIGAERDIDGKIDIRGMVRDMVEAQQMVNFWQSALTEAIGKVTHGTWVIAEGQVNEGNKKFWSDSNRVNYAYLPYKAVKDGGAFVPPPRWESQAPEIQSIVVALQIAENKLRAVAGFYGVESEEQKPEQSGRAILARQQQGERGASHFQGNEGRGVRHMGRVLLWMYPEVYDTARIKRINGIDDEEKQIQVYAGGDNKPQDPAQDRKGKAIKSFDLSSAGRYDVRITTGPSMATKRQEASSALMELIKANQGAAVLMDIAVRQMDFPGAVEAAKRLKRMLPPQALGDDGDADAQLMKAQATAQQFQKINKYLTDELNAKNKILETDQIKQESVERMKQQDLASKERIAEYDFLTQLQLGVMKANSSDQQSGQKNQLAAVTHLTSLAAQAKQHREQLDSATSMHREKLGAADQQQQRQLGADDQQQQRQLTAGADTQNRDQAHETFMSGLDHLREQITMGLEHSQEEHMAEFTASQQREAQERDIQAQADQQDQQPPGGSQ